MAASPPSLRVENTGDEINSAMDTSDSSFMNKDEKPETEDLPKVGVDAEEPFKKPAILAAPSLSSKRAVTTPPNAPAAETSSVSDDNNDESTEAKIKATSNSQKERKHPENVKDEAETENEVGPVKKKPEAKTKVLPTKGPPPGKYPPLPYTEPSWGSKAPDAAYSLEILKNGAIVDTVPLKHSSFFVVGRLPVCDVTLEHPSISRYHAIIQYRGETGEGESVGEERGFYIHDLGSTHGTVVNKNKIPPKTYIRIKVGHVLKFGGSTRLFVLQGPEFDEEEESEFTVTELNERACKQRAELERRMMGGGSDNEDDEEENGESKKNQSKQSSEESGCSWGIADDALPEDDNEENPFSTEFHEDQEAAYLKDPKKALQGFYDREGEELEFEYEEKGSGTWLCRVKLPVDDALGKQLVAELTHTGKKKDATIQCCLEACRMLEARGLLRQEAVSRKRKKKNWEDEDYYDSDDDTFLDRTGTVERKRQERMKKAGKIEERPKTYDSLVAKLAEVEKELAETQKKLDAVRKDTSGSLTEDPLDAFMTAVRSEAEMDAIERRKLHVHVADLRKEVQKLRKLVELTRPAQLPSLLPSVSGGSETEKPKKSLPLFGAMKGGRKFKLKTGTIGKLPPKRPNLPAELFNMKELPPGGEEEEEEEEEGKGDKMEEDNKKGSVNISDTDSEAEETNASISQETTPSETEEAIQKHRLKEQSQKPQKGLEPAEAVEQVHQSRITKELSNAPSGSESKSEDNGEPAAKSIPKKKKKIMGPSRPPVQLSSGQYPDDDPDYCVWVPPVGQSGDGRTHLNDKYGY